MMCEFFKSRCFRFSDDSRRLTAIVFLVVLTPVLALTAATVRITTAAAAAGSRKISRLKWSLRVDPDNPRFYHRLGMLSYLAIISPDINASLRPSDPIEPLEKALKLSPYHAKYWSDLATVCDALRRQECARAAFEHAIQLNPM